METRASHSSPCFLRVAEASAASSASKMTSLSTPFSLETASTTIRISLFTILVPHARRPLRLCSGSTAALRPPLGGQPRLANLRKLQRHGLRIHLELDALRIHPEERAGVATAPGARLLELHEHPRADEAPEVRTRAQHAVEPRGGDLERVGARDRILSIKQRRHLTADERAVLDTDPGGAVDEDAHHASAAAGRVLEVDELIAQ